MLYYSNKYTVLDILCIYCQILMWFLEDKFMLKLAVLIPCYNEGVTIRKVVEDCKKYTKEYDTEIFVYDNNSTDNTVDEALAAGATVRKEYKQGKGNVIRRMFREVDAECYIMLDGDDTYPPEHIPEMVEAFINKKADMVVGDRLSTSYFDENKRPFHNFGNKIVLGMINAIFNGNITDIMTGYRVFSYDFVKSFPVLSKGFEIETEMSIHALDKNLHIVSVPIDYRDRPEGSESKLNTISDGIKVIRTIFNLLRAYKPLVFFGVIALILFILAAVLFIPVLIGYFKTGLVSRFPTLIVAVAVAMMSLQSLTCGLILDSISRKDRQQFEIQLNLLKYRG